MSSPEIEDPGYVPIRAHFQQWLAERRAAPPTPVANDIPAGFITEAEFARQVNRKISTLRRWRKQKPPFGPPAAMYGHDVIYRETAAQEFFNALMQRAEAAREAPPRRRGRPRRA